eukprot:TRINITY_DN4864_c0_g1_i1.p1 TRINITY_DN4864_c0_g1~~TRINITY_DN4864_c0_g1_i1.p1  ORF type:complete len:399 (-),score=82.70 TRINITY_DN4864_c0_g1_i1:118-1314(-)
MNTAILQVTTLLMALAISSVSPYRIRHLRRNSGCQCMNLFSCMLRGGRAERSCSFFGVCCEERQFPSQPPASLRHFHPPPGIKSGRSLFQSPSASSPLYNALINPTPQCGLSQNAQRKIMGGLDAGYGQFPWTALLKIQASVPAIDKHCGGTLINMRWVVTAGHCTTYCADDSNDPDARGFLGNCIREIPQELLSYKVLLGVYDQLGDQEVPYDSYHAKFVVRHPEYRNVIRVLDNGFLESEPRYDIALLFLDREVIPRPNVSPICLPSSPSLPYPADHNLATVVGWGRTGSSETSPHSRVLQAVTVPMFESQDCGRLTGLTTFPDQLCAGGANSSSSACPGDSGGGLQQQNEKGRWVLVGIVSNGPSTCGIQPVVYHKVGNTLDWIQNVVQEVRPVP